MFRFEFGLEDVMFVASVIVSSLLAAALVYTAARKLTHTPKVVADYARAGVPERA